MKPKLLNGDGMYFYSNAGIRLDKLRPLFIRFGCGCECTVMLYLGCAMTP